MTPARFLSSNKYAAGRRSRISGIDFVCEVTSRVQGGRLSRSHGDTEGNGYVSIEITIGIGIGVRVPPAFAVTNFDGQVPLRPCMDYYGQVGSSRQKRIPTPRRAYGSHDESYSPNATTRCGINVKK